MVDVDPVLTKSQDFVPELIPRPSTGVIEFEAYETPVQCECWWTAKSPGYDGERMEYADGDCPVHEKDDDGE